VRVAIALAIVFVVLAGGTIWLARSMSKPSPPGTASPRVPAVAGVAVDPLPPATASANQLKALGALKRLQARIEVGVDFRDYSSQLANTWADVKALIEPPEPLANPHLQECLLEAIDDYKVANDSWSRIVVPQDDDVDRQLAVQAAKIDAMWDGPAKSLMALENEQQIRVKRMTDRHKNEFTRMASWHLATAVIGKAEAVVAGDSAKEARLHAMVVEIQADLKTQLEKYDAEYREEVTILQADLKTQLEKYGARAGKGDATKR
jgi:hypothetical protein